MPSFDEKLIMTVGRDAFKKDEPMCNHTTFRIGGSADYFIMPGSKEELTRVLTLLEESGVHSFIMGNGRDRKSTRLNSSH